jgi:hypothetical protein
MSNKPTIAEPPPKPEIPKWTRALVALGVISKESVSTAIVEKLFKPNKA